MLERVWITIYIIMGLAGAAWLLVGGVGMIISLEGSDKTGFKVCAIWGIICFTFWASRGIYWIITGG